MGTLSDGTGQGRVRLLSAMLSEQQWLAVRQKRHLRELWSFFSAAFSLGKDFTQKNKSGSI